MQNDKKTPRLQLAGTYETGLAHHLSNMSLKELLNAMNMIYEIEYLINRRPQRLGIKRRYYLN